MKTIQPVQVWYNGQQHEANVLLITSSNDNVKNMSIFWYQLINATILDGGNQAITSLVNGSLIMDGEAYDNWVTNDYAYNWVAEQINLTITGDYVPPTPEEPTVENVENL